MSEKILMGSGRSLLALYFLLPGILKLVAWDNHIALMNKHGMVMVPVLLAAASALQIAGGISLLINRKVVWSALALAGLTVMININLHDFWNYTGTEAAHEQQNFVKNLAILAGLLVLAGANWKSRAVENEILQTST